MGSPWLGFVVFFTLSLGLGLPLFFLAVFSGQLQKLPRSGGWMLWVRKVMGWVLVGMAVHFLRPILPESGAVLLMAGVVTAAGVHLGWLDKNTAGFRFFSWLKAGAGVACFVLATFLVTSWAMRGPGIDWKTYSEETLREAQKLNKPVIIDFYATWCTPCRELEEITFHNADIVQRAAQDFVMVKVDVTKGGNPLHERLLERYGVKGVPTVVFLEPDGQERPELRLVDYLPPDGFIGRMTELKKPRS
jgi:thiol:disulfide interchange protein DsbD